MGHHFLPSLAFGLESINDTSDVYLGGKISAVLNSNCAYFTQRRGAWLVSFLLLRIAPVIMIFLFCFRPFLMVCPCGKLVAFLEYQVMENKSS